MMAMVCPLCHGEIATTEPDEAIGRRPVGWQPDPYQSPMQNAVAAAVAVADAADEARLLEHFETHPLRELVIALGIAQKQLRQIKHAVDHLAHGRYCETPDEPCSCRTAEIRDLIAKALLV